QVWSCAGRTSQDFVLQAKTRLCVQCKILDTRSCAASGGKIWRLRILLCVLCVSRETCWKDHLKISLVFSVLPLCSLWLRGEIRTLATTESQRTQREHRDQKLSQSSFRVSLLLAACRKKQRC